MSLALELTAARRLAQAFGPRAAAAYLNVRGWSLASALAILLH